MSVKVEPFLHVAEVWVPDGQVLRRHSGAYGPHASLAAGSEHTTFELGQGLPGQAWSTRKPVLWQALDERFMRRELASQAGLDAGIALPIFRGGELTAVVTLLCGSREHTGGCIELWEPNELRELAFADGYYGRLEEFGELSRLVRFQRGRGLPGVAWETGLPHVIADLGMSSSFVRAAAARTSRVHAGLAIPLYRGADIAQLLVLLSAQETPLARAFEVWTPTQNGALTLRESYYASDVVVLGAHAPRPGEALARQVAETGMPLAAHEPQAISGAATGARAGFQLGLGIPIHDGEKLLAIVNLLN
jgi:GAF domain